MGGVVIAGRMPEGILGYYDHSTGCIHVDERLNRLDRHVTVVHERFHKVLKHEPTDAPGVPVARELLVESLTAEYLIPFRQLLDAFTAFSDVAGMARFLNVDAELIYARVLSLSKLERVLLQVCAVRCVGVALSAPHPSGVLTV